MIAQLFEFFVRQPGPRAILAIAHASAPPAEFVGISEHHELFGVRDGRKRGIENAVLETENRGVRPDAQRERKDRDGGECRFCRHQS